MRGGICLIFLLLKEPEPSKRVFIRVMIKHTLFPLLVQRLLRIVAREAMRTLDGKDPGLFARKILADIAYVDFNFAEIVYLDYNFYSAMCEINLFSRNAIPAMSITSADSIPARSLD
jgi:hypothetical protein